MTKTKNTKLSVEEEKKIEKENNLLLNQYLNIVEKINDLEESIEKLSDEELREKALELRQKVQDTILSPKGSLNGKDENNNNNAQLRIDDSSLIVEAFALVREASFRVLGLRHYDVQLIAGLSLNDGLLAEMKTGEGKTLVATLPAFLNALCGKGVFVVTANDYLAKRDAEIMGQVHRFLGLSVGLIQNQMTSEERREAYACDITYVTNVELGFDYLRDNLAMTAKETVMLTASGSGSDSSHSDDGTSSSSEETEKNNQGDKDESNVTTTTSAGKTTTAITTKKDSASRSIEDAFILVDEADSILIDEARTPLIISKSAEAKGTKYQAAKKIGDFLKKNLHYTTDEKNQVVVLTEEGIKQCEQVLQKSLYDPADPWATFIIDAIKARELFENNRDYIVRTNEEKGKKELAIVDSFSGRVLEGRKYSDGLQQAIEVKEGFEEISNVTEIIASVTYQSLFRNCRSLAGMTGTAMTDYKDFLNTYNLRTVVIPTALPIARRDNDDVIFLTEDGKLKAVLKEARRAHKTGQPILIGTTSVDSSEFLKEALIGLGIENCQVLNAKPGNIAQESQIVAQAGRLGAVTVATNMAGRGTDILLGGNASLLAKLKLRDILFNQVKELCIDFTPDMDLDNLYGLNLHSEESPVAQKNMLFDEKKNEENEEGQEGEEETRVKEEDDENDIEETDDEEYDDEIVKTTGFYPCKLSNGIIEMIDVTLPLFEKKVGEEEKKSVKETLDQIDELIAVAAENTPIRNKVVYALREVYEEIKTEYTKALADEKEKVKKLGGLYVIGTERHESRRIDNQLRGRSGRQGDPGTTRFFLSLDDRLFKIFGGDKVKGLMETFRLGDDIPLENKAVTDTLNKVQENVEDYFYNIRQTLLELDIVINKQRVDMYSIRSKVLLSTSNKIGTSMRDKEGSPSNNDDYLMNFLQEACYQTVSDIVNANFDNGKKDKIVEKIYQFFPNLQDQQKTLTQDSFMATGNKKAAIDLLKQAIDTALDLKKKELESHKLTLFLETTRYLTLVQIDNLWQQHLAQIDALKETAGLSVYKGVDPMKEYEKNTNNYYTQLLENLRRNLVYSLFQYSPKNSK